MKNISNIGERRKALSEIFRIRNEMVGNLDADFRDGYNACLLGLKRMVSKLEEA